jgi:sortase A
MTSRPRLQALQWGLALSGLLLVGLWARTELAARTYQQAESAKLDAAMSGEASGSDVVAVHAEAAPGGGHAEPPSNRGQVLGRLEIPRLRITAIVAEGVDAKTLKRAVGHVATTALPGGLGNCALAGHRDTFLRGLGNVRAADTIRIVTREHVYLYQVEWTSVVAPRSIDVLSPTPGRCVTLITCYPFRFIGHAPSRFIVRARQVNDGGVSEGGGS